MGMNRILVQPLFIHYWSVIGIELVRLHEGIGVWAVIVWSFMPTTGCQVYWRLNTAISPNIGLSIDGWVFRLPFTTAPSGQPKFQSLPSAIAQVFMGIVQ